MNNNPGLTAALLDAGADPNDGESLYHSMEHRDLNCMRLLLERGAHPEHLCHMLDREDPGGTGLLLRAGADPNARNQQGETPLHWAVWRRRSPEIVDALLKAGAEVDARRVDGRTAYALAVRTGQSAVARLLAAHGASTALDAVDGLLAACTVAGAGELERLIEANADLLHTPECARLLPDFAMNGHTPAVRVLLQTGIPLDTRGEAGATALHWACWMGWDEVVELLLRSGAPLDADEPTFHGTPPGWFGHGVQNNRGAAGDYARVARLLLEAGALIPPADLPTGNDAVDHVLREAGVIPALNPPK